MRKHSLKTLAGERPKRKYTNFQSFVISKVYTNGNIICPECFGSGRVVADGEFNDPVEGYKMARHHDCYNCKGTGTGKPEDYKGEWDRRQTNYKKDLIKWEEKMRVARQLLKSFSNYDLSVMQSLDFYGKEK
jgi:hypothetical protein